MHHRAPTPKTFGTTCFVLLAALAFVGAGPPDGAKPLRIGMAKTFFYDKPKGVVAIAKDDFNNVLKETTGLTGELLSTFGPFEVAQKLHDKQLDLGIFYAHEFAWVQKKYADLQPLLIAANKQPEERAYLIVHKNSPAKTVADLRGKKLDMPVGTKEFCRLFVERYCTDKTPEGPAKFFSAIAKSKTSEDALDEVCRDKVQVAVVDTSALEFYKEIKGPVFAKNLRVLMRSEPFPPTVIVYKQGGLGAKTLAKFREGLLNAHKTELGRDMMKEWKIDAFELIPQDYAKRLAEVVKSYPAPERQESTDK